MPSNLSSHPASPSRSPGWCTRLVIPSTTIKQPQEGDTDSLLNASLKRVLKIIAATVAPTTALAALLYYFGWAYTQAIYKTFGIEQSVLSLSNQDYIMRSISVNFQSLRMVLLVILIGLWVHLLIRKLMDSDKLKNKNIVATILGLIFILAGLGAALTMGSGYLPVGHTIEAIWLGQPIAFTLGFGLAGYGFYIWEFHTVEPKSTRQPPKNDTTLSKARKSSLAVVIGLVIIGLFWLSGNFAHLLGQYVVDNYEVQIKYMPRVTIYSQKPLCLQAQGVSLDQVSYDPEAFRYRYTGLRFLTRSGGKYFLLTDLWTPTTGNAIILPESDSIRFEITPGEQTQ